mgnify:CR=1 FL=1
MTLDPAYLEYPMRRRGMDHDLYPYSALPQRPRRSVIFAAVAAGRAGIADMAGHQP